MRRTELVSSWIVALRSGEFKQTTGSLFNGNAYCCLGVGLMVIHGETSNYDLLESVLGTSEYERKTLIRMNDIDHNTFPEIADAIEAMIDE